MSLNQGNLTDQAQAAWTVQSYDKKPVIEGVVFKELNCFVDDGGYFLELGRFEAGVSQLFPDFEAKQMSYSQVLPSTVKAFHLHFHQDDVWFVPPHERLLVVLSDQRKGSSTQEVTMRFVMGAGKARLVFIPRGVAHGAAAVGHDAASIIYFVNQHFNLENPDEGRLPWDFLGADIWDIVKG